MKLKNTLYLLLITIVVAATACNQTSNSTIAGMSKEDSAKIAFYDKYFSDQNGVVQKSINTRIPIIEAESCLAFFNQIKKNRTPNELGQLFKTESIGFNKNELINYLVSLQKTDSIRVYLGAYDQRILASHNKPDSLAGKMTVIMWPYLGSKRATRTAKANIKQTEEEEEPFNIGTIHP